MTAPKHATAADPAGLAPRTIGDPADNLAAFLRQHGHTPHDLLAQVGTSFGSLGLVVASGSVVVGYANVRSDVDLYAVGEVPDTQRVPVISHELGPLLDINLIREDELREQLDWIRSTPDVVPVGGAPANKWRKAGRALDRATRLAYGLILYATPSWTATHESLRTGWLTDRATVWWRLEARRRLVAARWLETANPALAAQVGCEARLCALKAVTAQAGYVYLNGKWVSKELRAMGRDDLLSVYRQALRAAWDTGVSTGETAEVVDGLVGPAPSDLAVESAYSRGVTTHAVGEATLVSRWEMRGALLDTPGLPAARRDGRVIWTGGLDEPPPDWLLELFQIGLVWVGLAHGAR